MEAILWAMSENNNVQMRQVEVLERIANALEGILKQQERIAFAQESHPEVKRTVELNRALSKVVQTKRP